MPPNEQQSLVTYDDVIELTINKKPKSPPLSRGRWCWTKCGGSSGIFQNVLLGIVCILWNSNTALLFLFGFLTKVPNQYECYSDDTGQWTSCTKSEICGQGISSDHYRPVTSDPEYIDNWVSADKLDLLCEPKEKIGLFGSMFFAGLCTTIILVPALADKPYGRKPMILIGNLLMIICMAGCIFSTNIYETYVFLFLDGASFAGRVIVATTYYIEYAPERMKEIGPFVLQLSYPVTFFLLILWYQFVDNSWLLIQVIMLIFQILATVYLVIWVPESPKWMYTWKRFEEAKEVLKKVAIYNAVDEDKIESEIEKCKFIDEDAEEDPENKSVATSLSQKMETGTYIKNLIVNTILWSTLSFTFYVLSFMTKYYEGGLYLNYYLDAAANLVGCLLALPLYTWLRMKYAFLITIGMTFTGVLFIMCFQEGYIDPGWITAFGVEPSSEPEGSKAYLDHYNNRLIPALVFICKLANEASFVFIYQVSFTQDLIFPFYKRATSVGIANFIARLITITAPIVAELDRPQPAITILCFNGIAFISCFLLPSRKEELDHQTEKDQFSKSVKGGSLDDKQSKKQE